MNFFRHIRNYLEQRRRRAKPNTLNTVRVEEGMVKIQRKGRPHYHLKVGDKHSGRSLQYRPDGHGGIILLDNKQRQVAHFSREDLDKIYPNEP